MPISEDMDWTEISIILFERWGFENVPIEGGWKTIKCSFHGDRQASARINVREGAFKCMACDRRGDLFKLVMEEEKLDFPGAQRFIEEQSRGGYKRVSQQPHGSRGRSRPRVPDGGKASFERGGGLFSSRVHGRKPPAGRSRT